MTSYRSVPMPLILVWGGLSDFTCHHSSKWWHQGPGCFYFPPMPSGAQGVLSLPRQRQSKMEEAHWLLTASTWMMHMKLWSHFMELALWWARQLPGRLRNVQECFIWETLSLTQAQMWYLCTLSKDISCITGLSSYLILCLSWFPVLL